MSIGNLDETSRDSNSDWGYMDRAIALLSAIETIKSENETFSKVTRRKIIYKLLRFRVNDKYTEK